MRLYLFISAAKFCSEADKKTYNVHVTHVCCPVHGTTILLVKRVNRCTFLQQQLCHLYTQQTGASHEHIQLQISRYIVSHIVCEWKRTDNQTCCKDKLCESGLKEDQERHIYLPAAVSHAVNFRSLHIYYYCCSAATMATASNWPLLHESRTPLKTA